ncbi:helix-turn-helix domain-containing protein [Asticcacaulis solisilvae]|uniref:helix-turn-helix domain-containing protein n=1 Tax=Asticcacaulis solisilvae TaxID=1217274 RepID=UPI003FD8758B
MTDLKSADLSPEVSAAIAVRVREELARRRLSRQGLADLARISLSTLEKALNGSRPFTLATVVRLESALDQRLRGDDADAHPAAPAPSLAVSLGAYTSEAVKWLEGDYLTLRPSFEIADAIFAYRTLITWDGPQGCLAFREAERQDAPFSQRGVVSVPNKSGHVYLHTNTDGQLRLAILGRPLIGGEMYGLLATLHAGMGTQLMPVSVPIALIPVASTPGVFGRILPGDGAYDAYRAHLGRITERGFAKFPMP